MKHEKFKVITLPLNEDVNTEVNDFLDNTKILPKSVSMAYLEDYRVLTIGYVAGEQEHDYDLVTVTLQKRDFDLSSVAGIASLEKEIALQAEEETGVVCQDVSFVDDEIILTFLVAE